MNRRRPALYDLLPAYVRYRDGLEGEPLRAVMETLELPYRAVLEDVEALYDGWFVETCDLWRVPYVADLLGVRGLGVERHLHPGQRARVGNALAYRRRKGTAAALERLAADASGWPCRLVEYRRTTAATAALDVPPSGGGTADLRRADDLDALGGPFNVVGHGVDLKGQDGDSPPLGDAGGFHPAGLGLALHRLAAYPVTGGRPRQVDAGCYTFHPFGVDAPLFHPARTADEAVYRSRPDQLPAPLRPLALEHETAARRRGGLPASDHLGEPPALRIFVAGDGGDDGDAAPPRALEPGELAVADLGEWRVPARVADGVRAVVDPRRGRFRLLGDGDGDGEPRPVRVDYHYGAAMDLGGGAYPRPESAAGGRGRWTAVVSADAEERYERETGVHHFPTLDAALAAWNRGRPLPIPPPERHDLRPRDGVVRFADSATYEVTAPIRLHGRRLRLEAVDGCRPCLRGDLRVAGPRIGREEGAAEDGGARGARRLALHNRLALSGLWIDGGVRMRGCVSLVIEHCTVDPPRPGRRAPCSVGPEGYGEPAALTAGDEVPSELFAFSIQVRHSILGPLRLAGRRADLELDDSLVDGGGEAAVEAGESQVRLVRCTLLGEVVAGRLPAAIDSLFTAPLRVVARGEGAVVSCRLAAGSDTPRREMCVEGGGAPLTATTYGHPAYGQLAPSAGRAVLRGAGDGNEIGVFNALRQRDRLDSLHAALRDHLPWGMQGRIWFAT